MAERYLPYPTVAPRMDKSVPSCEVQPGNYSHLVGIDGRFTGCLRKYFGNRAVVDLRDITATLGNYTGISYFKAVSFKKAGTSDIYRGFVVRWDSGGGISDEQVDLFYTLDNGDNWLSFSIWATGNSITSTAEMDCVTEKQYLFVCVKGKAPKTVYWNGSSLTVVDMGAGVFTDTLGALTQSGVASADNDYQLTGDGVYQVAYRFYDSKRGIYSALSDPVTVRLDLKKKTKANGIIQFNSAGGDAGLMVSGDVFTINGRTYEYISSGSDVTIGVVATSTVAAHCGALADAINGDSSAEVSASAGSTSVTITADTEGADGNAYTLSIAEIAPNQNDISVSGATFTGGGQETTTPSPQCKISLAFPDNTAVLSTYDYADFAAMFDTVDVFRSINLGTNSTGQDGAIFYKEQSIELATSWATSGAWDALTVTIGTVMDEALVFYDYYDPEKDIIDDLPNTGAITRYQDVTFMADGDDTIFSSIEQVSPEYFTTYNRRFGSDKEGEPLRYISTGDSLFILCPASVTHVYKTMYARPLQFTSLHKQRGLSAKGGAHAVGNSIVMMTGESLVLLNASDGSMGAISMLNRLFSLDWVNDIETIQSGFDSKMNASFFLNPTRKEMAIVWHGTQLCTLLEGANFVSISEGLDIEMATKVRAYFVTARGLVVTPDYASAGSGTMLDISDSYTLNGTVTTGGTTLIDTAATYHSSLVGTMCYITRGACAGQGREIATVNGTTLTFTTNFDGTIGRNDRYAISPVPVKCEMWKLQAQDVEPFTRWKMTGISFVLGELDGFMGNVNDKFRCGAYRGASNTLHGTTVEVDVDDNPSKAAEALKIDGIEIMPYFEQISSGTMFEITGLEVGTTHDESRKIGD